MMPSRQCLIGVKFFKRFRRLKLMRLIEPIKPIWKFKSINFLLSLIHCINVVRRGYLDKLYAKTGRNVIAYYSGFLSKPGIKGIEINDEDKNGFMMAIHKLDRNKGLDIILHTPGGGITSTQSIVDYLHKMFRS